MKIVSESVLEDGATNAQGTAHATLEEAAMALAHVLRTSRKVIGGLKIVLNVQKDILVESV